MIVLVLILLAACAPIPVSVPPELAAQHDLAEDLGIPVTRGEGKTIAVRVVDVWSEETLRRANVPNLGGRHDKLSKCRRRISVLRAKIKSHETILAHEYGHALGLEHRRSPRNLMHPVANLDGSTRKLTAWQRFVMLIHLAALKDCQ